MSRVRIMNSDKEVTAVKFNLKEQRCLQKNLVTLDAEASYSVKLIDMENRGMKVFYRRFRDKVGKIRSHLKVNEISRLRDLESSGRLSPPANTVNTTATLRIADAEKRLKLQGREHLRKTKSAVVSRSLSTDKSSQMDTILKASYDSHLNTSRENISTQKRPSTIAWDSKLNGSRESLSSSRRQSKERVEKSQVAKPCDSPQTIKSITDEELQHVSYAATSVCIVHGEENPTPKSVLNSDNQKRNSLILSSNFIQTGNLDSPRILNKTSDTIQNIPETLQETELGDMEDGNLNDSNKALSENSIVCDQVVQVIVKDESADKLYEQPNLNENSPTSQGNETENRKDGSENVKDESENGKHEPKKGKDDSESQKDIEKVKKCIPTEPKTSQHDHKHKHRESVHNDKMRVGTADSSRKFGRESPRSSKNYNKLAVPRAKQSQSAHCKSAKSARSSTKSNNNTPRRSISATGKSTNTGIVNMNKQYSCHNYDREAAKMMESRASFSISEGLFCFGDDPYEERRQLMIMDEHNRFVILLHKKEEYLERIEEYIRLQMLESSSSYTDEKEEGKKGKSPKDIWDELKKCRYLRKDEEGEEDIDLSTVVTLASEQMKNKQGLKYKPLFQKQKSKKTIIVNPEENAPPKPKKTVIIEPEENSQATALPP